MSTLFIVLHIIVAVLLVVLVLLQEGKDSAMQSLTGQKSDDGESFFSRNTGRTRAAMLSKVTAVLSVLFLITTMVLVFLQA